MTERAETKIKICGLSRAEDICYVNEARPDYCGFVIGVPKSRRNVTEEQLRRLRRGLREGIPPVGVFVNADPRLVAKLLEEGLIDAAQLHGGENEEYIRKLREMTDRPLIQAFSVSEERDLDRAFSGSADWILINPVRIADNSFFYAAVQSGDRLVDQIIQKSLIHQLFSAIAQIRQMHRNPACRTF